jgi:CheY-like chemotaxis protein
MQRILVVECDQNVALTLREGLEGLEGCRVSVTSNGRQALRLFEQKPFDVLITDYKMPGTDGLALATRVRELSPRTSIVMVTAYRDDTLWQEPAAGLVYSILDKPVGLQEIRSTVARALGQARSSPVSPAAETCDFATSGGPDEHVLRQGSNRRGTANCLNPSFLSTSLAGQPTTEEERRLDA